MVSTIIIWPHFTNKESEAEVKKLPIVNISQGLTGSNPGNITLKSSL